MTSTNSRRRCASSARLPATLVAIVGAAAVSSAGAGDEPRPSILPLESEGNLRFFVDVSGFRGANGRTELEAYVSITNDQIEFRESPDSTFSPSRFGPTRHGRGGVYRSVAGTGVFPSRRPRGCRERFGYGSRQRDLNLCRKIESCPKY